jgi:shikimate kinase
MSDHSLSAPFNAQDPLFLVGYRGSGKSSAAQLLAQRLGWDWLDVDAVLEERTGRTIRQIFAEEGEEAFRDLEAALLFEFSGLERVVVATGGGVVLRPENRQCLKESGCVIWLKGDAGTLWERIQADATTAARRPALTVGGLAEVEQLLRVREACYADCAHLSVDTVGRSVGEVVEEIVEQLTRVLT